MKGLNTKRIAAIGLGAALVGSVLAPAAFAANVFDNMTTLKKENVIDSTGMPVVDIIVGSQGKASDVVWAGNIAAKVAQLAVTPVAGSGAKTVNLVVGGTTSIAGAGRELDKYADDVALSPITAGISDVPTFAKGSVKIKYPTLGTSYTDIAVDENVKVTPIFSLQTDADKNMAGQMVAEVAGGAVVYSANYGTGIPFSAGQNETALDSNANVDMQIPFMGKTYTISEIHSTSATAVSDIVLFSSTTPSKLMPGQSVTVNGASNYAGKQLTVVLSNIYVTQSGTATYNATWDLMDGTTTVKEVNVSSTGSYDLKDQFGSSYFTDSVYVTNVAQDVVANKYYASIRTGTDRLEIKNNDVFPYNSAVNGVNKLWNANIIAAGSTIKSIQIVNNRAEWQKSDMTTINAAEGRYGPVAMGASFNIPGMDYLKYEFLGLESKPMSRVVIGNEQVIIADTKGIERTIPFIIQLNKGQNNLTVGGKDITVDVNETDKGIRVWNRNVSDVTTVYSSADSTSYFTDMNVADGNVVKLQVSSDWKNSDSGYVDYVPAANMSTHKYYLFLDAQSFDVYGTTDTINNELTFVGTVDTNTSVRPGFYLPDKQTYNFVDGNLQLEDGNGQHFGLSTNSASNEGDNYVKEAVFTFNEGVGIVTTVKDVNAYVDTSVGSLINTQDNKNKLYNSNEVTSGYGAAVHINENTTAAAARLLGFGTVYGSTVSAANQVLTIMKPSEPRKIMEYLGSTSTSTTTAGGTTYTSVGVGQTQGNVTVTAINGATTGVTVNQIGNIVKLDSDYTNGKSIIVGGQLVNTVAQTIKTAEGTALSEVLVSSGDYVAEVLNDGSIIVAGYTASDTATAARALISALDGF